MAIQPIYVPILKGKEGEFAALEELTPDIRGRIMPLIEVPEIPYDYANQRRAKSLDQHVAGVAERLRRCFPDGPLYLDLPWFGERDFLEDGRLALEAVLADCAKLGVNAVPVVSRTSPAAYINAAANHAATNPTGVCVRLVVDDFKEEVDLDLDLHRVVNALGGMRTIPTDLVIDLEDVGQDVSRAILIARSVFSMLPKEYPWRRMILAAASFPQDLSDVDAATTITLPRHEWNLWNALQRRPKQLPSAALVFGDYTISHPIPKELDPRTMRMSANIRYTTKNDWLIVKGRNVRQYGFDQYFDLCDELIERDEYSGREYSWGDKYIEACAKQIKGPGNATTWRKVGVNHHLTLVTREIANLLPGS